MKNLMIGDWVNVGNDEFAFPDQIYSLGYDEVDSGHGDMVGTYRYDELFPIPLTPEILEKNEFNRRANFSYEWKERIGGYMGQITPSTTPIEIIYYDEGHCVVSNPHIGRVFQGSIDSVHELQHCLKLCGIDKTIEL